MGYNKAERCERQMNRIIKRIGVAVMSVALVLSGLSWTVGADGTTFENTHVNTGDMAADIVAVAKTQVGYHEGSLDGLSTATDDYTKYGVWYDEYQGSSWLASQPWCAMFVSWCAYQAGIPSSVLPYHTGCHTGVRLFTEMNAFYEAACYGGTYVPKAGDIVYFGDPGDPYHVGIVTNVQDGRVYTVEGNTSKEAVSEHNYALDSSFLYGYGVPLYTGGTEPEPLAQAQCGYYRIHADLLNVRSGPSTDNDIVGSLLYDSVVRTDELTDDGWGKVTLSDGTVGWCSIVAYGDPVLTSGTYTTTQEFVLGVTAGTTANTFLQNVTSAYTLNIAADDTALGSGMTVTVSNGVEDLLSLVVAVRGDVNGDGAATTADARQLLRGLTAETTFTGAVAIAADTDENGVIQTRDARKLLQEFCG